MKSGQQENRLGREPVGSLLVRLSIPSILSMLIQALYNIVDSIWVGKYSLDAFKGLSLAFPLQMILIALAVGTGIGANSLISRSLGKGETEKASSAAEHVLITALVYGGVIAFIGAFFSYDLIGMFTDKQELVDYGARYIKVIFMGSTAMFIPMISNNILRGEGNTLIPMVTMFIGSFINIALDPFLIFGWWIFPELGVEGAALATIISRVISGTFILIILFKGNHEIKLNFKNFKPDLSVIKGIYIVGLPAMAMQMLASVMIGGLNKILAPISEDAIASLGIYFKLQSFVFMPVFGLNQGYMPLIGYNYGHNRPERMKKGMKLGFISAFVITTIGFVIFQLFPEQLVLMFADTEDLTAKELERFLNIGKDTLKTISIAFPIIGPAIVGSSTFQALGKGLPSLILSFSRQIILLLPLALILSEIGGLDLIWYSFPIAEGVAAVAMVIWLSYTLKKVFSGYKTENT
ncbi:MATE family efflux transporter [Dethiothermospora halolimnae]|uniref:MATE family efflux transporter n=1 Tax=Dethiothermospora halolimnae TaxID=3114390 RepID=UPI003CCB7795